MSGSRGSSEANESLVSSGGRRRRAEHWDALTSGTFDLLIIGGGINGAGLARDAVLRGLKVALVDRGDFAEGTSSRSSKLIHGGLRYLETYEFGLVRESTAERAVQMKLAPHLVKPIPFWFPIYRQHKHGVFFMDLGLWLYDILALFRVPKVHRAYASQFVETKIPDLRRDGLTGALWYFDCATDDARLTLENVLDAADLGAVTLNHAEAVDLLRSGDRVEGAVIQDKLSDRTVEVRAKVVVSTLGPFTDAFFEKAGLTGSNGPVRQRLLRPTRGSHLVFSSEHLPVPGAVVMLSPRDDRPVFAIPWGDRTYVGTTDVDHEGPFDQVFCTSDEVEYLVETLSFYFPELDLSPADVVGIWSGLRPLVDEPDVESASRVSREHEILDVAPGLIALFGGKLTTYRLMVSQVMDRVSHVLGRDLGRCPTRHRLLPGAIGFADPKAAADRIGENRGAASDVARHLVSVYGSRADQVATRGAERIAPGRPVAWGQVDYAVETEMAQTIEDVLIRRTSFGLKDVRTSLEVAESIADRMGALLGWDEARRHDEVAAYRGWVEQSLRCLGGSSEATMDRSASDEVLAWSASQEQQDRKRGGES
ncbi:MAG: glycerol-3-phosphate dehydrogenase/oxidase [Deltaproteobacteria bacterium]|nr:glycerol-3-phosphate dehydrogenase/oxidase [Deltaproteobacteria bacterium]